MLDGRSFLLTIYDSALLIGNIWNLQGNKIFQVALYQWVLLSVHSSCHDNCFCSRTAELAVEVQGTTDNTVKDLSFTSNKIKQHQKIGAF